MDKFIVKKLVKEKQQIDMNISFFFQLKNTVNFNEFTINHEINGNCAPITFH